MTEAVYFDLDGTLFDDRQYVRAGLRAAGAELAAETGADLTDELIEAYFERGITESTFDTVLEEHDLPLALVPSLVEAYHNNGADLDCFPEVVETIETLSKTHNLGIITGGRNGRGKLAQLGIDQYFETVFVSPEFGSSKRRPEIFEAALASLDVTADAAVYVGDRPSLDFPQSNNLGMTTVRLKTGRYMTAEAVGDAQPDIVLDSITELPDVLATE